MTHFEPVRVVQATTVHNPFDVRIYHKQCVTLAEAGYDVTLLQRGDRAERLNGVNIVPLPSYQSRLLRMTVGVWKALRHARAVRAEVFHIHDPELIWGAVLLKLLGVRIIYDVHENLHLDIAAKQWVPGWLKGPLGLATRGMEKLAAIMFDHVCAATDGIADRFPSRTTTIVRNAPRSELFDSYAAPRFNDRPPNLIYVGGLGGGGDVKGVDLMLAVLGALPSDSPLRLLLGGREPSPGFVEGLKARPGGDRIDYVGWIDQGRLPELYGQAIATLVLYPPMPNNVESEPVKLFESMAAGVPVVISDFPLFKKFMTEWYCGVAIDAADAAAIAKQLCHWEADRKEAERLGGNGRRVIQEQRSWQVVSRDLLAMYGRVTGPLRTHSGYA